MQTATQQRLSGSLNIMIKTGLTVQSRLGLVPVQGLEPVQGQGLEPVLVLVQQQQR
jgi:hypothetical protein